MRCSSYNRIGRCGVWYCVGATHFHIILFMCNIYICRSTLECIIMYHKIHRGERTIKFSSHIWEVSFVHFDLQYRSLKWEVCAEYDTTLTCIREIRMEVNFGNFTINTQCGSYWHTILVVFLFINVHSFCNTLFLSKRLAVFKVAEAWLLYGIGWFVLFKKRLLTY